MRNSRLHIIEVTSSSIVIQDLRQKKLVDHSYILNNLLNTISVSAVILQYEGNDT